MTGIPPVFDLAHIYKRFGNKVALRDVSLTVQPGEAVALLGANGAGKTTLLRITATLARPTRGTVQAFGVDAWTERTQVRAMIGVVAHQPYLYPELTCRENLGFFGTMYGIEDVEERSNIVLEQVGLAARAGDLARTLSRGLLQRLNLARALLHAPAALVLDEPDTGLDAAGRALLAQIVGGQRERGGCIVLTTHALDLALEMATRVVVMAGGQLILDAPRAAVSLSDVADAVRHEPVVARR